MVVEVEVDVEEVVEVTIAGLAAGLRCGLISPGGHLAAPADPRHRPRRSVPAIVVRPRLGPEGLLAEDWYPGLSRARREITTTARSRAVLVRASKVLSRGARTRPARVRPVMQPRAAALVECLEASWKQRAGDTSAPRRYSRWPPDRHIWRPPRRGER